MTIVIFIVALAVLILVHELGHFAVAKLAKMRVDEFGLGLPPRIFGIKKGETIYSINWIPFGGFVKIFGENSEKESLSGGDSSRSFSKRPRLWQAAVLVAGVLGNLLFAWLMLSVGLINGLPVPGSVVSGGQLSEEKLLVTSIMPGSPAERAGIKAGDEILFIQSSGGPSIQDGGADEVSRFLGEQAESKVTILHKRGAENVTTTLQAEDGVLEGRKAIGVGLDDFGIWKLSVFPAIWHGFLMTGKLTIAVAAGLGHFVADAVTGSADFSQVTGPVGIAGIFGEAQDLGYVYLIALTAFISINLAVINLAPFPALDGGRLLIVFIEAILRRPIKPAIVNTVNTVGFALLLLLMLVVTYRDVVRLLG
ncbi:MAG: site-2 protease family protein [bacterium]|nr:site-2 protease family protein [bacterium]